jgi:hypothetical protein
MRPVCVRQMWQGDRCKTNANRTASWKCPQKLKSPKETRHKSPGRLAWTCVMTNRIPFHTKVHSIDLSLCEWHMNHTLQPCGATLCIYCASAELLRELACREHSALMRRLCISLWRHNRKRNFENWITYSKAGAQMEELRWKTMLHAFRRKVQKNKICGT